MEWFEAEVVALERRLAARPPPAAPVVFYGSSSIRLWTSLAEDFPDVPALNLGFGGSTLAACSWFYWRIVRPVAPRSIVLYAGDNDLGDGRAPAEVVRQLGFLLKQVDSSAPGTPVSVMSIKPSPARWSIVAKIEETNRGMRELLAQRACGVWVDVFPAMLASGRPRPELFAEDGLHLNAAGYSLWREVLSSYRPAAF